MNKKIIWITVLIVLLGINTKVNACSICTVIPDLSGNKIYMTLNIEGMTSKKNVSKVKAALKGVEGVKKVKVSLKNKQATIKYNKDKLTAEELLNAVKKAGFKAKLPVLKCSILDIEGMTCNACAVRVKSAIKKESGVIKVKVDLQEGKAFVEFEEEKVSVEQLIMAVNKAGFKAKNMENSEVIK